MIASVYYDSLHQHYIGKMHNFWAGLMDEKNGGYYGEVDSGFEVHKSAVKGCILNSRILWFFSHASETLDSDYLAHAKQAYDFLVNAFLDREYGGVYWSVTADGKPCDDMKHTYNMAFAIYGLAAYYEVSNDPETLSLARDLMRLIEEKCRDEAGYLEAFSRDFGPHSNEHLSENGVMATRTMNTLLHVMEAYTELHRVAPSDATRDRLREILLIFRDKIYNPKLHRLEVFFDKDYNSLIDLHSYGHDIEASWLIDRTVEVLKAEGTEYDLSDITEDLRKKIYEVAFDGHSLPAECCKGEVLETRVWWVQCEAVLGFFRGYLKTGNKDYANAAAKIYWYLDNTMISKTYNYRCWFPEILEGGVPDMAKNIVDAWTCPYHSGRMYYELEQIESKTKGIVDTYFSAPENCRKPEEKYPYTGMFGWRPE